MDVQLFHRMRVVFVESFCRVSSLSATGLILYKVWKDNERRFFSPPFRAYPRGCFISGADFPLPPSPPVSSSFPSCVIVSVFTLPVSSTAHRPIWPMP